MYQKDNIGLNQTNKGDISYNTFGLGILWKKQLLVFVLQHSMILSEMKLLKYNRL